MSTAIEIPTLDTATQASLDAADKETHRKAELLLGYSTSGQSMVEARIAETEHVINEFDVHVLDGEAVERHKRDKLAQQTGGKTRRYLAFSMVVLGVLLMLAAMLAAGLTIGDQPLHVTVFVVGGLIGLIGASIGSPGTAWVARLLEGYVVGDDNAIPLSLLELCCRLKQRLPFARFYVESLGVDPFIYMEVHGVRWYLGVWDESGLVAHLFPVS